MLSKYQWIFAPGIFFFKNRYSAMPEPMASPSGLTWALIPMIFAPLHSCKISITLCLPVLFFHDFINLSGHIDTVLNGLVHDKCNFRCIAQIDGLGKAVTDVTFCTL